MTPEEMQRVLRAFTETDAMLGEARRVERHVSLVTLAWLVANGYARTFASQPGLWQLTDKGKAARGKEPPRTWHEASHPMWVTAFGRTLTQECASSACDDPSHFAPVAPPRASFSATDEGEGPPRAEADEAEVGVELWALEDGDPNERIAYTNEPYARQDVKVIGLTGHLVRYVSERHHLAEVAKARAEGREEYDRDLFCAIGSAQAFDGDRAEALITTASRTLEEKIEWKRRAEEAAEYAVAGEVMPIPSWAAEAYTPQAHAQPAAGQKTSEASNATQGKDVEDGECIEGDGRGGDGRDARGPEVHDRAGDVSGRSGPRRHESHGPDVSPPSLAAPTTGEAEGQRWAVYDRKQNDWAPWGGGSRADIEDLAARWNEKDSGRFEARPLPLPTPRAPEGEVNLSDQVRRDELRSEIIRAARVMRDATQVIIEESDDEDALDALDRLNRALENFAMWTYEQLPDSARGAKAGA